MRENNSASLEITFKCEACGGTTLELPDNYTDDSVAVCADCKVQFGRFGDVKAKALDAASERVLSDLKQGLVDGMKGVKGITIN